MSYTKKITIPQQLIDFFQAHEEGEFQLSEICKALPNESSSSIGNALGKLANAKRINKRSGEGEVVQKPGQVAISHIMYYSKADPSKKPKPVIPKRKTPMAIFLAKPLVTEPSPSVPAYC